MQITTLWDRILVKPIKEEKLSPTGIYLGEVRNEDFKTGEVITAGEGRVATDGTVTPLTVKPGDKVLFGFHAGMPVDVEGVEHLVMREDDVLGIVQ